MSRLYGGGGFKFAFDVESVGKIDEMIDRNRRTWMREGSGQRMMNMFGAYLGEAVINEYGGDWVEGYGVEIEQGFVVNPFVIVGKRIANGIEEESCATYFSMIAGQLEQFRAD
eukprot:CAMPEP_0184493824 /NCGR_PEP_ID=MMETSP0113_2-20130426/27040_1 /TAXON_ID=91329 /ORGANISM="Norrisiella sphaerica, Strain BC52" /LENGTH=112 /DNA_ID=CAMNT_0026879269 /DNA_START=385 /DNA_END=723 /DNA_ORIENTATION=-